MSAQIKTFDGHTPVIAETAFIAPGATVVGDVTIGEGSSVWYSCVLRGDDHFIRIGQYSNIQDGSVVHVTLNSQPTIVGDRVVVGHNVVLHGCEIGDDCLVGIGSVVLDGAVMEPGSMLAAGSLLTPGKRVPSGELWGGSPAKKMREMTAADREYIDWDIQHYIQAADKYRKSYSDNSYQSMTVPQSSRK